MFNKRGAEQHINIIAIITVTLIIVAGILIVIDSLPKTIAPSIEIEEQYEFVSETKESTLADNIETIQLELQVESDCVATEIYDVHLKRCVFVCEGCTNETKSTQILTSFISESFEPLHKEQTVFGTYRRESANNTFIRQNGDSNITGLVLTTFVKNQTYERKLLTYATELFPLHTTPQLSAIHFTTDSKPNTLSTLTKTQSNTWELTLDILESYNPTLDTTRITHHLIKRFGEVLFFDFTQIRQIEGVTRALTLDERKILAKTCPHNYFSTYGCMKNGAYLDEYYNQFWSEIYTEWLDMKNPKLLYSIYDNSFHKIDSTKDPLSDMTNAWTYFILTDKPTTDTILSRKVLFFYEYPELLRIRDWIRANIE